MYIGVINIYLENHNASIPLYNGRSIVISGNQNREVELLKADGSEWETISPLPLLRYYSTAIAIEDKIFVFGKEVSCVFLETQHLAVSATAQIPWLI